MRILSVCWLLVGPKLSYAVYSLAVDSTDNTLVAAGGFDSIIGTDPVMGVARWDGNSWDFMVSEFNGYIKGSAFYKKQIYAGGTFTKSGNLFSQGVRV